jgi:RNA polymerase sigma-70 factor (ECF subfamily)
MELTDKALMLAVKDGNVEKMGVLFARYYARLFDFLYRMTGDSAASEDLVQEVFLRMLKYRSSFGEDSEFRAWMYQIARNVRIDFLRKRPREKAPSAAEGEGGVSPVFIHRELEHRQHNEILSRAMLALPEDKREVLVLARYQELKYDEIAGLLDIGVGTVKVRVHRAMSELREIFFKMTGRDHKCIAKSRD